MKKTGIMYSIYLNVVSLIIGILCLVFSIIIDKFTIVTMILLLLIIVEMIVNIISLKKHKKKKK